MEDSFFSFPAYGRRWNSPRFSLNNFNGDYDSLDDVDFDGHRVGVSNASRSMGGNVSQFGRLVPDFWLGDKQKGIELAGNGVQ